MQGQAGVRRGLRAHPHGDRTGLRPRGAYPGEEARAGDAPGSHLVSCSAPAAVPFDGKLENAERGNTTAGRRRRPGARSRIIRHRSHHVADLTASESNRKRSDGRFLLFLRFGLALVVPLHVSLSTLR